MILLNLLKVEHTAIVKDILNPTTRIKDFHYILHHQKKKRYIYILSNHIAFSVII